MDETAPEVNRTDFAGRPKDSVSAILPAAAVDVCLKALRGAGVDVRGADVLVGPEGRAILDGEHAEHPFLASIYRLFQHAGTAGNALKMYEAALDGGSAAVFVPVTDRAQAEVAATVLKAAAATYVQYFNGGTAVESL